MFFLEQVDLKALSYILSSLKTYKCCQEVLGNNTNKWHTKRGGTSVNICLL